MLMDSDGVTAHTLYNFAGNEITVPYDELKRVGLWVGSVVVQLQQLWWEQHILLGLFFWSYYCSCCFRLLRHSNQDDVVITAEYAGNMHIFLGKGKVLCFNGSNDSTSEISSVLDDHSVSNYYAEICQATGRIVDVRGDQDSR